MKIGILTFHCAYNYGAMLQCYALQEYLSDCGIDVSVIDYRPSYMESLPPKLSGGHISLCHPIRSFKRIFRQLPALSRKYESHRAFEKEYYRLTSTCRSCDELGRLIADSLFDYIIIGSDQVWNSRINGADPIWYADVPDVSGVRFVAYAASAGDAVGNEVERIRKSLSAFVSVSVREKDLSDRLKEVSGSESMPVVADPVILAEQSVWEKMAGREDNKDGRPYILVYQGQCNDAVYEIARHLAEKYGADIISADYYLNSFARGLSHTEVGPDGFVSMVRNALCVVTTSFHGAALSIVLHTPFYVVGYTKESSRCTQLLERAGLSERMISPADRPDTVEMDFTASEQHLDAQRKESRDFLNKTLGLCI